MFSKEEIIEWLGETQKYEEYLGNTCICSGCKSESVVIEIDEGFDHQHGYQENWVLVSKCCKEEPLSFVDYEDALLGEYDDEIKAYFEAK